MVFLILLIIATAVLLAWLLFAIARLAIGDLRYPRLRLSLPRGPSGSGEASAAAPPLASAQQPAEKPAEGHQGSRTPRRGAGATVLYDESEAERVVREHLYGQRGQHA